MWLLLSSLKFRSAQTAQILPAGKTNLSRAKSSTAIGRMQGMVERRLYLVRDFA
jgi:hypothetical protein